MPTIREVVAAIRQRDGVEAAIVLGRDGLLIDGQAVPNLDAEGLAAHVPSIVTAADVDCPDNPGPSPPGIPPQFCGRRMRQAEFRSERN